MNLILKWESHLFLEHISIHKRNGVIYMLFSVIVPCYNVELYIDDCIKSILNQTYDKFELILVNDGSTDNTKEILNNYARDDNRIRVVNKQNGGLTSARKAGTELAIGDYIVPVDGDDFLSLNYLEIFCKTIIKYNHPDVLSCGYLKFSKNKEIRYLSHKIDVSQYFSKIDLINKIYPDIFSFAPHLCGKVFKRELYKKFQMSLNNVVIMGEDSAISYPVLLEANSLYLINQCLYHYRVNEFSLTQNSKKNLNWNNCLMRIQYLECNLPMKKYNLYNQLSCNAVHSIINVIISRFYNNNYAKVKSEIKYVVSIDEIRGFIHSASNTQDYKIKICSFALKYNLFFILKLGQYFKKIYNFKRRIIS